MGPRAGLDRCEKSHSHRDIFLIILLSFAEYTTLFVESIFDTAVMFTILGLVQLVRISCWRHFLAVGCRGWPSFGVTC